MAIGIREQLFRGGGGAVAQCCNKSSHWLRLESHFLLTWLDSSSLPKLIDLTRVTSESDRLTSLWLDHMLTRVMTLTHKFVSVNNVELWTMIVLWFNFRLESRKCSITRSLVSISRWFTPPHFGFFLYGHWDDDLAVDELFFVSLQKGITLHHTDLSWLEGKNDLTWLEQLCDLTWLDKNSNDLTQWRIQGGGRNKRAPPPPQKKKLDQLCFFPHFFFFSECLKIRLRKHERALKQLESFQAGPGSLPKVSSVPRS